jgi:ABC-type glycerol-3-phosphate transport system substrate-binding protein
MFRAPLHSMRLFPRQLERLAGICLLCFLCGCQVLIPQPEDEYVNGRIRITYWEKWTGFEGDAIKQVVNRFNEMQDRIYVDLITMSQIDQKALIAIAGGDPPDLVGLWSSGLPQFAEKRAVMPLAPFMERAGMRKEDFIQVFIDLNCYRGELYGLPTTPATMALHWNKRMFREAGLDPDRPPRTLAELDEMAARLTKYDAQGHLIQVGFSPGEPGWWPWAWGFWFGGELSNDNEITFDSPENLAAFRWIQSYTNRYGAAEMRRFQSGLSTNFASPQNAFFSEKVAMELQGVWTANFIHQYAPKLEWAAAPFPSAVPGMENVTIAECDCICIPVGTRHPDEAFEFMKFLCSQEGSEMLNMAQQKFTPLKKVSPAFIKNHPNEYIQLFIDLASSSHACHTPDLSIWFEYLDEIAAAFDLVRFGLDTPEHAVSQVQQRASVMWKRAEASIERREQAEGKATP